MNENKEFNELNETELKCVTEDTRHESFNLNSYCEGVNHATIWAGVSLLIVGCLGHLYDKHQAKKEL